MVENIESQIDTIEGKLGAATKQLETANKGIFLLCNVVAESIMNNDNNNGGASRVSVLYQELVTYTSSAMSIFKRSTSAPDSTSTAPPLKSLAAFDDILPKPGSFRSQ